MIDDLRAMAIFAELVHQGSFRKTGKVLTLSPSVVSYHITQLEKRLGTALIYRSTRKLSLTHEGEVLYLHAKQMLAAADAGLSQVTANSSAPSGKLTITLPSVLTRAPLNRKIAEFCKLHQQVELNILYTDIRQDLIAEGIDLAIRIGDMPDSTLKSKRLGDIKRKLVCSADYWANREPPASIEAISSWHWVKLAMLPNSRRFVNAQNRRIEINFSSRIT
ncbi:MAG: LysR family transcriptional regulator, partial [Chromatiales bacterium]|nr:LysR family transcriptional regulator [Chromatiales bacterium]